MRALKNQKVEKDRKKQREADLEKKFKEKRQPRKKSKAQKEESSSSESDEVVAKDTAKESAKEPAKLELKKIKMTGSAPVDEYFPKRDQYHVLEENGVIYDLSMNQTNIKGGNNNNKFYIAQVLTNAAESEFFVFFRWGRVGTQGQIAPIGPVSKLQAIKEFEKKKASKSEQGDYRILERDFKVEEQKVQNVDHFETSKLPLKVRELIRLIFDMKMINNQMREIGYDAQKMPLGKLAASTIQKGFKVLEQIASELKKKKPDHTQLDGLSSDFYSYIPHDFGRQRPPSIDDTKLLKQKLEMLESIQQIQIATTMIDDSNKEDSNILDNNYAKLGVNVTFLDPESDKAKIITEYIHNTHAATHNNYKLEVLDIYELQKDLDDNRFKKDLGNRMLLWHGSRLTNFVGILSQGLRIAPPEAPATGYMFGKGVYFADMVSKSANYCGTSYTNDVGCILLGDVALGEMNVKYDADYNASQLPPGKSSTLGKGKTAPPPQSYIDFPGLPGVKVPIGKGELTDVARTSLLYNEYIVYDVAQIRLKYLIKLKWNFRK